LLYTILIKCIERGYEGDMKDIAIQTARDPAQAALFNHASMAWNNHFFFEGISPSPTTSPSTSESQIPHILQDALKADFGSIESFRAEMLAMADAMFGPGFVWLVRVSVTPGIFNKRKFMLLPTYLAGSPLPGAHNRRQPVDMNTQNVANAQAHGGVEGLSRAQYTAQHMEPQNTVGYMGQHAKRDDLAYGGVNLTPCLCVNTWEHAYMYDWKYNKKMFLERWWNFVNWERVNTLADVARDKEADGRRQFQGVSSAFGRRY
jgi:Fe-Mn family superoxide dismutase